MGQYIYIGETKKIGDIDLKKNRVYTEKPVEIISQLKEKGFKRIERDFITVKTFSGVAE